MGRLPAEFQNLPSGPTWYCDFIDFKDDADLATTKWTFNVTNSTAPTTVEDEAFGVAKFTNAAADNDRIEASRIAETIYLNGLGKTCWVFSRFKLSDVTESDFGLGLVITDTAWLGDTDFASDGVWFEKNDGDAYLDLVYARNATAVADYGRASALKTLVADTYYTIAYRLITDPTTQGTGTINCYVDGSPVGNTVQSVNLPYDEVLALSFGIQNGAAAAKSLYLDYIGVAIER